MSLTVLVTMLLVGGVRAGYTGYTDTCNYTGNYVKCGDQCIDYGAECQCGSDTFLPYYDDLHCCIPSGGTCTRENGTRGDPTEDGVCSEGRTLSMSNFCNNANRSLQCYNSFQDSQYIGSKSHITCPNTCVPWQYNHEMCRGVSPRWCEGYQEMCGPNFKCPPKYLENYVTRHNITSSLVPGHHYCLGQGSINDRIFDSPDRSDESVKTEESTQYIDIASFIPCKTNKSDPGLMCGSSCKASGDWCRGDRAETCDTDAGKISTIDSRLCNNPNVWRNVSCSSHYISHYHYSWPHYDQIFNDYDYDGITGWNNDGNQTFPLYSYGLRCNGSNMQCVYPWYITADGDPPSFFNTKCSDKSDQVFNRSLTCREHLEKYMDIQTKRFCKTEMKYKDHDVKSLLICTNKTQWLSFHPSSLDPHSCQLSCSDSESNLDCLACTNQKYFMCTSEPICLHPDLECDGHPQCKGGEDEDRDKCYQKYLKGKTVEPVYPCKSATYRNLDIYATPCNYVFECADGSDELGCKDEQSNTILIALCLTVMILYLAVTFSRHWLKKKLSNQEAEIKSRASEDIDKLFDNCLKSYNDRDLLNEVNVLLFNSIYSNTVEEKKKKFVSFYDFVAKKHNNNEAEIYHYLKANFDPQIVQVLIDCKFPGCLDGFKKCLETMARTKFITWITDFITSSERSKVILSTIISVIKMETKFLDLFKDLGLSIYLLGRGEYSLEEWNDFESKTRHFGQKKLCSKLPFFI